MQKPVSKEDKALPSYMMCILRLPSQLTLVEGMGGNEMQAVENTR